MVNLSHGLLATRISRLRTFRHMHRYCVKIWPQGHFSAESTMDLRLIWAVDYFLFLCIFRPICVDGRREVVSGFPLPKKQTYNFFSVYSQIKQRKYFFSRLQYVQNETGKKTVWPQVSACRLPSSRPTSEEKLFENIINVTIQQCFYNQIPTLSGQLRQDSMKDSLTVRDTATKR
jgi:hypothetical protein